MKRSLTFVALTMCALQSDHCLAVNCGAPLPKTYSAAKANAKIQCLVNAVTALQAAPVATSVVQETNFLTITVASEIGRAHV